MAESTLTLCYIELMSHVAHFLYGITEIEDLSTQRNAVCDEIVQMGYRQFIYPPAAEGIPTGYEWTFLRPVTTIETVADDADQDLPEDFGRLIGDGFTFEADAQVSPVLADVGEGKIRRLRLSYNESGRPRVAGLRRMASDGTEPQWWEVMWYPMPDAAYTLHYRYEALVNALTSEKPHPLGGIKHAETIRASCIAAADAKVNDIRGGDSAAEFIRMLASSIKRDKAEGQKFFGNVGRNQYDDEVTVNENYTMTIGGEQMYP